jgi:hypothetical protein
MTGTLEPLILTEALLSITNTSEMRSKFMDNDAVSEHSMIANDLL